MERCLYGLHAEATRTGNSGALKLQNTYMAFSVKKNRCFMLRLMFSNSIHESRNAQLPKLQGYDN